MDMYMNHPLYPEVVLWKPLWLVSRGVGCKIKFLTYPILVLQCLTMNTLTIRLPNEIRDIVRESIRRYVAVEKFRTLRKKALPFAEAQGFLTDEDVFKAIS
jgi:hypothetical protein